jgi:hypothetical protein
MRTKRRRYTGALATPVVAPTPPTFEGAVTSERVAQYWERYEQHQQDTRRQLDAELGAKLSLLMAHYDIDERSDDAMGELAYLLACEHVPGFRIVKEAKSTRGRKREWDGPRLTELYNAVESAKGEHNLNDRLALAFLASRPNSIWNPPPRHKGLKQQWVETLESRLQDAKKYVASIESLPEEFAAIRSEVLAEKFRK